jgi:uncharacterized protein (DUF2062 family)
MTVGSGVARLSRSLGHLFKLDDTPERVALSFGVGTFIGMSAFLGVHVVSALVAAQCFRLNRKAMLIGVFVNNPWTLVPFYSLSAWLGLVLLNRPRSIPAVEWSSVTAASLFREASALALPLILGSTCLGLVAGFTGYVLVRNMLRRVSLGPASSPSRP